MIAVEDTVLVLLAAGESRRFGDIVSKLDEEFLGKPLGLHVAVALGDMPFRQRIAIVDGCKLDYSRYGFEVIANPDPKRGMAGSVRIGVERARALDAAGVLIALADMPRVTSSHVLHMFDVSQGADTVVASSDGVAPKPPALFGRDQFEALLNLDGDSGARDLVAAGRHVVTTPAELIDIDTPAELAELRKLVRDPALLRPSPTRAGARRSD